MAEKENKVQIKMTTLENKYVVLKAKPSVHSSIVRELSLILTDSSCTAPVFFARTPSEISFIIPTAKYDEIDSGLETGVLVDNDWICFMVIGPMPFNLVGILAKISNVLADASISLLAQSTYDTDYILIKHSNENAAKQALIAAGIKFLI